MRTFEPPHDRRGFTLLELLVALCVLGVLLGIALPPLAHWRDRAAVHAARDEIVGALAWTRVAAVSRRGATLVLDAPAARFWTESHEGTVGPATDLGRRYGVRIVAAGGSVVHLHYDALGIGRIASHTIRVRRHGAEAGLTVSAYGRVRRW